MNLTCNPTITIARSKVKKKRKKKKKKSPGTWELKNKFSIAAIWSSEFQNKYLKEF